MSAQSVLIGAATVLFALLCVAPVIWMLSSSFVDVHGDLTLNNYLHLFADARKRALLLNSLLLGVGVSTVATLLGLPLGLLLARSDVRGKAWWRLVLSVPLVVPPYVLALAWTQLAGAAGFSAEWTYSLTSAVFILGLSLFPLAMMATEAAARRVQASLEEAALLVAAPSRVAGRITLPLIAPAIAAAALVVFVLAVSEFGVPGLLRVNVFTTEVFTAFAALYDFGAATALSVPLLLVTLLAAGLAAWLAGEARLTAWQSGRMGLALHFGGWRVAVEGWLLIVLLVSVCLPVLALAGEAATLSRIAAALRDSGGAVFNSLVLSSVGATLAVALALLPGYARARMHSPAAARLFDLLFITLFAVPGTVVGVGLIGLWNRPGLAGAIYASPLIIVLAYLARFAPVAALLLAAGVRQMPISWEEAAAVAGASWWRSFTRIVLPNLKTSLAAAWAVAFIFAFGEIGATILVAPPGEATLPVRVYTLIANTPAGNVAALALTQVFIAVLPLALFAAFIHREGRAQ
jgi:iron(III) transport system permease protein